MKGANDTIFLGSRDFMSIRSAVTKFEQQEDSRVLIQFKLILRITVKSSLQERVICAKRRISFQERLVDQILEAQEAQIKFGII